MRVILNANTVKADNDLDKVGQKIASKLVEGLGVAVGTPPSPIMQITRGVAYSGAVKTNSTPLDFPVSGYFEFINKSREICCIKVLLPGGNAKFEIPRPSYFTGGWVCVCCRGRIWWCRCVIV